MTEAEKLALFTGAHGLALATLSNIAFSGFAIWGTVVYFSIGDSLHLNPGQPG